MPQKRYVSFHEAKKYHIKVTGIEIFPGDKLVIIHPNMDDARRKKLFRFIQRGAECTVIFEEEEGKFFFYYDV